MATVYQSVIDLTVEVLCRNSPRFRGYPISWSVPWMEPLFLAGLAFTLQGQVLSVSEGHPHIVGCASDGPSFSSLDLLSPCRAKCTAYLGPKDTPISWAVPRMDPLFDLAFTLQGQVLSVFQPEGHPHISWAVPRTDPLLPCWALLSPCRAKCSAYFNPKDTPTYPGLCLGRTLFFPAGPCFHLAGPSAQRISTRRTPPYRGLCLGLLEIGRRNFCPVQSA